eukprot:m51a1_g9674 hypothetical protein (244) ;mRNA; r:1270166-1275733
MDRRERCAFDYACQSGSVDVVEALARPPYNVCRQDLPEAILCRALVHAGHSVSVLDVLASEPYSLNGYHARWDLNAIEMVLATMINTCSLCNILLSLKKFLNLVHTIHPELADHSLQSWALDFLTRWHNHISARTSQDLSSVRIAQTTLPTVQQWVNKFSAFMQHNSLSWLWIVNTGETRIKISSIGSGGKVLMGKRRPKTSKIEEPKGKFATYLLFITSARCTLFDLFIILHQSEGSTEFPI